MAIFKKKAQNKTTMASAPEEPETPEEIKHIDSLSDNKKINLPNQEDGKYVSYPVCLSQTQINNMIIENNMMLKELLSMANEED